jgi:hypothetical protein
MNKIYTIKLIKSIIKLRKLIFIIKIGKLRSTFAQWGEEEEVGKREWVQCYFIGFNN